MKTKNNHLKNNILNPFNRLNNWLPQRRLPLRRMVWGVSVGLYALLFFWGSVSHPLYGALITYKLSPQKSTALFSLDFAMPLSSRQRTLEGEFKEIQGELKIRDGVIVSLLAQAPITSVDTRSNKRDRHLQQDDFFDAERYPEIALKLVSISGQNLLCDLKIKDTVRRVAFKGKVERVGSAVVVLLTGDIKRLDFDLAKDFSLEGRGAIGNDVTLDLKFVFQQ